MGLARTLALPDEISSSPAEGFERPAEKVFYIPLNLTRRRFPARCRQVQILLRQETTHDGAKVPPFVNELVEHAGVGVLRREAQTDEFQPHPGDLLDEQRNVVEPPAAEEVEVAEFAGQHAKVLLVLARQS